MAQKQTLRARETLRDVFIRYPNALWLFDFKEPTVVSTSEVRQVVGKGDDLLQMYTRQYGSAPDRVHIRTPEEVERGTVEWHGANVQVRFGNTKDPKPGWIMRLVSTGFSRKRGYRSLGSILLEHRRDSFGDLNRGGTGRHDENWLSSWHQGDHFLGARFDAIPENHVAAFLAQPVILERNTVYAVDPGTGKRFYLLSMRPAPPHWTEEPYQMRGDAPLVRHIAERFGERVARQWQNTPYIDGGEFQEMPDDPIDRTSLRDPMFHDIVLGLNFEVAIGPEANPEIQRILSEDWTAFVRISTQDEYRRHSLPWRIPLNKDHRITGGTGEEILLPDHWLCVEVWVCNGQGTPDTPVPYVAAVDPEDPDDIEKGSYYQVPALKAIESVFDEKDRKRSMSIFLRIAHAMISGSIDRLAYLSRCPEYVVEVRPKARGPMREGNKKPWTDMTLPSVRVMSPKTVKRVRRNEHGGTHRSPRAHMRRGHWRLLSSAKFTRKRGQWVLIGEIWVGDKKWEYHNAVYKVLNAGETE